jgi:hypothetical protein
MNTLHILTAWTGSGTYGDPYRPALADAHAVASWVDLTGADPKLNQPYTIQAVCDDATLAAIQQDPNYQGKVTVVSHGL